MKVTKRLVFIFGLTLFASVGFIACDTTPDNTGNAQLGVSIQALSAADVDRVTITVSGANITPDIVRNLHFSQGQWKGIIGGIPAGTDRTFFAQAFDNLDNLIYEGEVDGVEITQGNKTSVIILLQQKNAPDPFENTAPTIDSILASSTAVSPDDPVDLEVQASDVDLGDTLTYAWTATDGAFDDAASETPVWTAPATEGSYTLTIEVTDSKNAKRAVSLDVDVQIYHGRGRAAVEVDFNTWPEVAEVNADSTRLNATETTTLSVSASDNDSDTLSYAWVDDCGGLFGDDTDPDSTWTAPDPLPGATCTLTVTVTDGRGGTNTGDLTINLGEAEDPNIAPVFEDNFQSTEEADDQDVVYLDVTASDADGDAMTFSWVLTSGEGTLGTPVDTADTSEVQYTSDGYEAIITARVTDSNGAFAEMIFIINEGQSPEHSVNTLGGYNGGSKIGVANDGSFVVAWGNNYGAESDRSVLARRYDVNGDPYDDEFVVNTYSDDDQTAPDIGMAGDGRFVIVWHSEAQDGDSYGVYGQRFNADGTTAGGEFQINTYTTNIQGSPAVDMADDGTFVVVWVSLDQDTSQEGIFGQRFDANGNTVDSEFQVNTTVNGIQKFPDVVLRNNGSFVVVWQGYVGSYEVFGQRFNTDGTTAGSEFQINTTTSRQQVYPDIDEATDGSFLVIWESTEGQDGDWSGVFGQHFDASGTPVDTEFQVNTYTTDHQANPAFNMADDGSFFITWTSAGQDGELRGIFGQFYDSNGDTDGDEIMVNVETAGDQYSPAVGMSADGSRILSTWNTGSYQLLMRLF